jgi:hypothetical protein
MFFKDLYKVTFCDTITAARSPQDSWASPAKKIRPLEKKLGSKPTTPPKPSEEVK